MEDARKTRKTHKKSRGGCLPCKNRHVKCDETKPECVNCDKYGTGCEYPRPQKRGAPVLEPDCGMRDSPGPALFTPSSNNETPLLRPFPDQSAGNGPQQLELNIPVLRLLHHFQTVTARTLVADPGTEDMYQSYLIKLGLDYTFLLHAVLALAALHLSRLEKQHRSEYLNRAVSHHDVALAQFKDQVQDLNEDNFQAVLFFASTMFPYSCAIPLENGDTLTDIFSGILSNIELTRRMRAMVTGVYQAMLQSEIARLVPVDTQGIDWHNSEPPQTTELGTLRKFAEATRGIYPPDIVDAYGHAIHVLDIAYSKISELLHPPSDALLKMWIHMITPRFMELLSERQPGALIIFSHYGVLLGRGKHYWFLDGLAEQILHIADAFVPTEWTKWLEWPREQIFKDRTQLNTA